MLLVHEKSNNFELIRIAMALLVVWSHSFVLYWGMPDRDPLLTLTRGFANSGGSAVDVFFVVSGFLIMRSYAHSKSWRRYLGKRIARIYPGYLSCTAACAFVVLPLYAGYSYDIRDIFKTIVLNLFLLNRFVNSTPFTANPIGILNGSLWSIPIEFGCYIGVLIFGALRLHRAFLLIAFSVLLAFHLWATAIGKVWWEWPYMWYRMGPFFIAGMIVFAYRETLPRSPRVAVAGLIVLLVCAWIFPLVAAALFPAVLAYAVFHVAFGRPLYPAAKYGDFSYGVYLYSYPIQQLLRALTDLSFPAYMFCSLALSLLAGIASWFIVERWFLGARAPLPVSKPVAQH